jgi:hypothetical protein
MNEVQATVVDGILPNLLDAHHNDDPVLDDARTSHNLARISSSQSLSRTQDTNIDRIANSVDGLHDTMTQLKSQFTALRIELNNPNNQSLNLDDDVIRHLLSELKAKTNENAHLKLENESLKLKSKVTEERQLRSTTASYSPFLLEAQSPSEMRSPGLLNEGSSRGIGWPGPWTGSHTTTRRQVADSFDGDGDQDLMEQAYAPPRRTSLKHTDVLGAESTPQDTTQDTTGSQVTSQFRTRATNSEKQFGYGPHRQTVTASLAYEDRATKRPRLTGPESEADPAPQHPQPQPRSQPANSSQTHVSPVVEERRRPGRPRTRGRSSTRTEQPALQPTATLTTASSAAELPQTPTIISSTEQTQQQPPQEVEVQMTTVTIPLVDNAEPSNTDTNTKPSTITRTRGKRGRSRGPGRPSLTSSSTAATTQSAAPTRYTQKTNNNQDSNSNPSSKPAASVADLNTQQAPTNEAPAPSEKDQISKQTNGALDAIPATTQNDDDDSNSKIDQQRQKSLSREVAEKDLNGMDTNTNTREKRRSLIQARDNLAKMTMEREEAMALAESDE